jgi:hypothetical protein
VGRDVPIDSHRSYKRALLAGLIGLTLITIVYLVVAEDAGHPVALFVLPGLFTAILGGWRPTLAVGLVSLPFVVVFGLSGPWDTEPLIVRWVIISVALLMGGWGAFSRDRQLRQVDELGEVVALRSAFERALMPHPLPPAGLVAMSRFRPAESRMGLGGDFLDAVALPDGRLAILIGDVCGHGPREAAFGTALRAGWKAIALSCPPDPSQWVSALEMSFFRDGRIDTFATVCTGYFDPEARVVKMVNAGHPLPIRLGESAEPIPLPASTPLGVSTAKERAAIEIPWFGEPVIFYTDGLVENPKLTGPPQRWGEEGLTRWIADHMPADPHSFIDALIEEATAEREIRDDVALLLIAADEAATL